MGPLSDPIELSVLLTAVQWVQQTMLGTLATTVAIIAVAALGFMMLTGRVDYRRGVTVILGCFIIFCASSIVAGIQSALGDSDIARSVGPIDQVSSEPPVIVPPNTPAYDPYAGASVPLQ